MKLSFVAGALLLVSFAAAQDGGLGRGRGRGGGSGGGTQPPTRNDPPRRTEPPARTDPPRRSDPTPPREPRQRDQQPNRNDPPSSPGRSDPGRTEPGRSQPPSRTDRTPRDGGQTGRPDGNRGQNGIPGDRRSGGLNRGPVTRSQPPRSGNVRYGTVSNLGRETAPIVVNRAPARGDFGRLTNRVYRTERVGIVDGYRVGYAHYDRSWRDDYFWYPHYAFSPFGGYHCVSSPFYGYSFLPPYLDYSRVVIFSGWSSGWSFTTGYPVYWNTNSWSYNNGYQNGYDNGYRDGQRQDDRAFQAARDAVDDLSDAFLDNNSRYISRLIPRSGAIAILRDGDYDYSLNPDDFEDLIRDLVENSRTERYRIEDSRARDNEVRLVARHDYTDAWGQTRTMFHHILLSPERGRYVIREFGTSANRYW